MGGVNIRRQMTTSSKRVKLNKGDDIFVFQQQLLTETLVRSASDGNKACMSKFIDLMSQATAIKAIRTYFRASKTLPRRANGRYLTGPTKEPGIQRFRLK